MELCLTSGARIYPAPDQPCRMPDPLYISPRQGEQRKLLALLTLYARGKPIVQISQTFQSSSWGGQSSRPPRGLPHQFFSYYPIL